MFERILVGTDGSDTAAEAVRQAIDLAKATGAKLGIVSAFEPVPQSRLKDEESDIPGDVSTRDSLSFSSIYIIQFQ